MSIGENIRNYYEHLVNDELKERYKEGPADIDHLSDIACVALNRLQPRYYRHEIDMAFYLSPIELEEMRAKVRTAVDAAIGYVESSDAHEDEWPKREWEPKPLGDQKSLEDSL